MKRIGWSGLVLAGVVAGLALPRVWADGIAADGALHYAGVLEEDGAPVDGARAIEVLLWDDATDEGDAHLACSTADEQAAVEHGRFRIALDASCADAVRAHPELWAEVRVEGQSLGRTKVGAVPYAVESGRAAAASGALQRQLETLVPPGTVIAFAGDTPPEGWLPCDGSSVSRADYPALFAAIGTTHGEGEQVSSFRLPDFRGRFLRGVDGGAGRDRRPGRSLRRGHGGLPFAHVRLPDRRQRRVGRQRGHRAARLDGVQDDRPRRRSHPHHQRRRSRDASSERRRPLDHPHLTRGRVAWPRNRRLSAPRSRV